ncbi:hypothetical protein MMC26_005557 [Xylographa opegraphella]|nr:hypothetical protein [Xylographa opegraphella]
MARRVERSAAVVLPPTPQAPSSTADARRHTPYTDSPPRTPSPINRAARGKGKARAARKRPALPDTFNNARGQSNRTNRNRSDSHDLSWSPRQTRESVVDNMLLSLDQLFVGSGSTNRGSKTTYSPFDVEDQYTPPRRTTTRERSHTLSSSISSDYDMQGDDSASRSPSRPPRGHGSNSSTNFQSALGRIDSVRAMEGEQSADARKKIYGTPRAGGPGGRTIPTPSSGRKGSKSSGSSSLDFGQMGPRWQRAVERRSASFDHGYSNRSTAFTLGTTTFTHNTVTTDPSHHFQYDNDDAAPNPTIPAGPRGPYSPQPAATFPPPARATGQTLPLRRKDSKRSQGTLFSRHESGNVLDSVRNRGKDGSYVHTRNNSKDAVAVSRADKLIVRDPSLLEQKHSENSGEAQVTSIKERPGFFRRVFGSAKTSTPTTNGSQAPMAHHSASYGNSRAGSRSGQRTDGMMSGMMSAGGAPAIPVRNASKDLPQAPLNKKSSFFRRRKKSISDHVPLPVRPVLLHPQMQATSPMAAVESSPVSSLRKVMDPYLNSPAASRNIRQRSDSNQTDLELSKFPDFTLPDQSLSNPDQLSYPTVEYLHDTEESLLPQSDGSFKASHDTSLVGQSLQEKSFPAHISEDHNFPVQTEACHVPAKNGTIEPFPMQRSTDFTGAPKTIVSKHIMLDPGKVSHSRSGSDKELPRLPTESQPLALLSTNTAKPKYPAVVTKRTTSKDWNGGSVLLTPTREESSPSMGSHRSHRVWLQPTASEEDLRGSTKLPHPYESQESVQASAESILSDYKSATSKLPTPTLSQLPTPTVEITPHVEDASDTNHDQVEELESNPSEPTDDDRILAKKIFEGGDDAVDQSSAAVWLGDFGADRTRVRSAYMELFDWQNLNILAALRSFCNQLLLKAETQQVDRILDAFSVRWCTCNPNHGFKATDVVHTICYSILLLNTDLHMAEIEQKMTRSQFIKNTMPTIRRVATDAAPHAFKNFRASILPQANGQSPDSASPGIVPASMPQESRDTATPVHARRPSEQLVTRPSDRSEHDAPPSAALTPLDFDAPTDDCGPLVRAPFYGRLSTWEVQVEIVLKDFYNSIRQQRLPLFGSEDLEKAVEPNPSSNTLSVFANNVLRRTPSMLSKAGSESQTTRGRLLESRIATGRWTSKTRSRPRLYPSSIVPSSRTSFDDDSSMMSPSASSIWSKYSIGKTQTSMSVTSFASSYPHGDYQQSIGFANALSQAIIREEAVGSSFAEESLRAATLLEDESLELAGAPWAKEGILKHKHHLESGDKKAKDRHWNECFAVVEKGWMRLFQFNMNAKSMRLKAKNQKLPGGVVGGGNWTENAEPLGKFLLRQTIASALPPPGYSKLRPHVWALSLPTGAVHLFQVGTPEIVKEFVSTANYWSARLSKEPLVGGISNVEYGWSEGVINFSLVSSNESRPPSNLGMNRPSLQSSIRSSLDQGSTRPRLPGDRVVISDWTPPQQSMMASVLMEVDQLKALLTYVKNIEDDLQKHNQLRSAMLLTFSPRHPNHNKAMSNWERKSSYLLREIVKFRTYADCLQAAQVQKEKVYAEKARALEADADGGRVSTATNGSDAVDAVTT